MNLLWYLKEFSLPLKMLKVSKKRHLWKRKPVTQREIFSPVIQKSGFI